MTCNNADTLCPENLQGCALTSLPGALEKSTRCPKKSVPGALEIATWSAVVSFMLILAIGCLTRIIKLKTFGRNPQLGAIGKTDGHRNFWTESA